MITWNSVDDEPFPKDGENYLGLFKGQFALISWDEDLRQYEIMWMPNTYDCSMYIDERRYEECYGGNKLTHWAKLVHPKEY